jgi:signal transduction histidine kinase
MLHRLSIRTKLIAGYTVVFGTLLLAFAAIIYETSYRSAIAQTDLHLEEYMSEILDDIDTQVSNQADTVQSGVPPKISIATWEYPDAFVDIFGPNAEYILGDSLLTASSDTRLRSAPRREFRFENVMINEREYRCLRRADIADKAVRHVVCLSIRLDAVERSMRQLQLVFIIVIPSALVLAGIAALRITKQAFKPITSMIRTTRTITANNLQERLELPDVNDDVHLLGETLNAMIDRIDRAFQSQKQFVADASHEIRTPLTILRNELEFARKTDDSQEANESIDIALEEIDRLSELTEALLFLSKVDSRRLQLTYSSEHIIELIDDCLILLREKALAKSIIIEVVTPEHPDVHRFQHWLDAKKIKSVFINLVDNAIKYSPESSVVHIACHFHNTTTDIVISDHGYGIAPEELSMICNRFYRSATARTTTEGSGLGLAIAKSLVQLHGGQLLISSTVNIGSVFTVRLPFHRTQP